MQGDETIDERLALFQKRKAAGTTEVPNQMPDEDLPPEMRKIRKRLKSESDAV